MESGNSAEGYGDFSPENFHFPEEEKNELSIEQQAEILKELDSLLADIIEKQDLSPTIKQQMRQKLQSLCNKLGADSIEDPSILEIRLKLHDAMSGLPIPKGYPEFNDFKQTLELNMANAKEKRDSDLVHNPSVLEVMRHGRVDYSAIKSRTSGKNIEEYLYNVGKILCSRLAYESIFKDDPIILRADWSTANGRHRVTALKGLGEEYLSQAGLAWVNPELEPDSVFREDYI